MTKVTILGAGAAPGVPSLSNGWGNCNPNNIKNYRHRTSTYYDFGTAKILVDTSPDMLWGLKKNNIRDLDCVLYTHSHADHLHGIDDLREINRISGCGLDIYAVSETMSVISQRFGYLLASADKHCDVMTQPHLIPNIVDHNIPFYIKNIKITPIRLIGHNVPSEGYVFNDGEIVHIADFRSIDKSGLEQIKIKPKLLIIPLTTPYVHKYHACLEEILDIITQIAPQKAVINHLASECDYDEIMRATPNNVEVAYDNMLIEL